MPKQEPLSFRSVLWKWSKISETKYLESFQSLTPFSWNKFNILAAIFIVSRYTLKAVYQILPSIIHACGMF